MTPSERSITYDEGSKVILHFETVNIYGIFALMSVIHIHEMFIYY